MLELSDEKLIAINKLQLEVHAYREGGHEEGKDALKNHRYRRPSSELYSMVSLGVHTLSLVKLAELEGKLDEDYISKIR